MSKQQKPKPKKENKVIKELPKKKEGPFRYQTWILPENKEIGTNSKWIEGSVVEAKNRRTVVEQLSKTHKNGTWKVRQVD